MTSPDPAASRQPGNALRADCANCFGLCCVVPAFAKSSDFAIDKPAEQPCANLLADSRCGIHTQLRQRGFTGCTVYDCFGAGQRISQQTFDGVDWRDSPGSAKLMFAGFRALRPVHELLWYLGEAASLTAGHSIHSDVTAMSGRVGALAVGDAQSLTGLDIDALRQQVNPLLSQVSELARAKVARRRNHRGADLMGAKLRGADLRGANLRGAYLIGADLRNVELGLADVIGADLRGANLRGADLRGAIFLVQSQLDSALGDASTRLDEKFSTPAHW